MANRSAFSSAGIEALSLNGKRIGFAAFVVMECAGD